jgi:hypothetical protein
MVIGLGQEREVLLARDAPGDTVRQERDRQKVGAIRLGGTAQLLVETHA